MLSKKSENAVEVCSVTKRYNIYDSSADRLIEALSFGRKKKHTTFSALDDVSFTIKKGTTTGIVGRNGSGKSTVLKIISSVLQPTSGQVKVSGKIAALLELGTGFNPEFTGRDNILINGTLMGLTQTQIKERMPSIEAFADIGEFINHPFKTYSSGMQTSLAFATAIHVDPDILIVDEALAVGDARFQQKCYKKFHDLQLEGCTIILVTHEMHAIPRYCDEAILLERGKLVSVGKPKDIVRLYSELLLTGEIKTDQKKHAVNGVVEKENTVIEEGDASVIFENRQAFLDSDGTQDRLSLNVLYNSNEYRFGNGDAQIIDVYATSTEGENKQLILRASEITLYIKVHYKCNVLNPVVGLSIKNKEGVMLFGANSRQLHKVMPGHENAIVNYKINCTLELNDGDWFFDLGIADHKNNVDVPCDIRCAVLHFLISRGTRHDGLANLKFDTEQIGSAITC